jgi:hypothetical protein
MISAHQPGSRPLDIPEAIPNPAVPQPTPAPLPDPSPSRREPAKVPVPLSRMMMEPDDDMSARARVEAHRSDGGASRNIGLVAPSRRAR